MIPGLERLDAVRRRYRDEAMRRALNPRDVDLLLMDVTNRSLSYIVAHGETPIDPASFDSLIQRRFGGEPLQYIRGRSEFFSREFYVDDRVLIPRPETEVLVETAIARARPGARVVDIGTGSGCIAISVERSRGDLRVMGCDVSVAALAVAHRNRRALNSKVQLVASDVLSAFDGNFDLVLSNPPYIAEGELASLAVEVRDHEPHRALTPGPRGTEVIERVLDEARGAEVIMEIGYGQEDALRELAHLKRYNIEAFVPDLAGILRVVVLSAHGQ